MDTLSAIFTRRSVRTYAKAALSQEQIDNLLKAAMLAPSAGNSQPWHFVLVNEPALLEEVATIHPHAQMITAAKLAILVCAEPALERFSGFWPQDCSAAIQNILLAAHAQGLGAVWVGIYPALAPEPFKKMFHLPVGIEPMSLVVIGKNTTENLQKEPPDRYLANRIHFNKFNNRKA